MLLRVGPYRPWPQWVLWQNGFVVFFSPSCWIPNWCNKRGHSCTPFTIHYSSPTFNALISTRSVGFPVAQCNVTCLRDGHSGARISVKASDFVILWNRFFSPEFQRPDSEFNCTPPTSVGVKNVPWYTSYAFIACRETKYILPFSHSIFDTFYVNIQSRHSC
jgi:hypothetical protein